jgi:ATP-binding cassette subfamily F protein uup
MLTQRNEQDIAKADTGRGTTAIPPVNNTALPSAAAEAKPARKLSFKDKHALETLPAEMARLEAEIKKIAAKLSDGALFTRDRAQFDTATQNLAVAQRSLEAAETLWLELEERKAALDARE